MSAFRENLKQELLFRNIKVKELSARSGVNKRTIDHYLAENSSEPLAEAAVKIARALGVSAEYLVTGKDWQLSQGARADVAALVTELNRMSEDDLKMFLTLIRKYNTKGNR